MKCITFGLLSCMFFGQASALERVPDTTLSERFGFFIDNTKNFMAVNPISTNVLMGAFAVTMVGAGYVAASCFDCLPASAPSVNTIKDEIRKILPKQTPLVIAAECAFGLVVAHLLQNVPGFVGRLFQDPLWDGV